MFFSSILDRLTHRNNETSNSEFNIENPHSYEILKHSKNYSSLLDIYVISARKNMKMKMFFKISFFVITLGSMIAIIHLFDKSLQYAFNSLDKFDSLNDITMEAILSLITVILPSISSLIVAFIKIPEIIARYLFNIKEDNYMNSVIKNIQDYDKSMFAMEHRIKELLMENKDQNPAFADDSIMESPVEEIG